MDNKERACNGCVCKHCTESEKQGNVYGCNRCRSCAYVRLMTCDKTKPVEDKAIGALRL